MSSYTDTHYFKTGIGYMCNEPKNPRGGAASSVEIVTCHVCLRIMYKELLEYSQKERLATDFERAVEAARKMLEEPNVSWISEDAKLICEQLIKYYESL